MGKNKRKNKYDWEAVRRDFATGQFTLSELSQLHGPGSSTIWDRSKKEKWRKDLTEQVNREINAELLVPTTPGAGSSGSSSDGKLDPDVEREGIELAVRRGVDVITGHRKDLFKLKKIEKKLLKELDGNPTRLYLSTYQGNVIEKEVELTVTEKSSTLRSLVGCIQKRILLERVSFNLDDKETRKDESAAHELLSMTDEELDKELNSLLDVSKKLMQDG